MGKLHEVEAKLEELIEAHRAMAAQHEALFQTSKIMFALIEAPLPMVQQLLQTMHRVTLEHRGYEKQDSAYQSLVEAALQELQAVALAARNE
jgi:allophanate hydrolase subunit 1